MYKSIVFVKFKTKLIVGTIIIFMILLSLQRINVNGQETNYDSKEYFSDAIPGENFAGDWSAERKIFYTVKEENGNRFLELLKAQHIDYFINESPKEYGLRDFSASFKVKITQLDDEGTSILSFGFRANDISNSYLLSIGERSIQITDMDLVEDEYINLPYNRKVIAEKEYDIEKDKWYQVNIVSQTVEEFRINNERITVGSVRNTVFINGEIILDVVDEKTWFEGGMVFFYSWDIGAYIDEIFISSDISKYYPTSPTSLSPDFFMDGPSLLEISTIDNSSKEDIVHENIKNNYLIYALIISTIILGLSLIFYFKRKKK